MKRIIALLISAIMLVSSVTAIAAVDFSVEPITVTYSNNAAKSNGITVKGTYDKPLVLRVFDNNGTVIYIDTTESENGAFEFETFELKQPSVSGLTGTTSGNTTTYDVSYQFVISDETAILNESDKTVAFQYAVTKSTGGGGGTSGPSVKDPDPSWDHSSGIKKEEEKKDDIPANEDPLNPENKNNKLWDKVNKVKNEKDAEKAIADITKATDKDALKGETARNNVATAGETMGANISAKTVKASSSNRLTLNETAISSADLDKLDKTMSVIEKSIKNNKITLNRQMARELILNVNFNNKSKATITISKKLVEKLKGVDVLTIKDKEFKISYTVSELKEMLGEKEEVSFEIDKSGLTGTTKKIAINFDTDKTKTMKISFPGLKGDSKYMAIVDENGNPVGGRYNPATGAIEAKIAESGVYQIVNNEKDFEDIKNLSKEMQESIKILAAKGIIEGTSAKEFSPEDSISRAEVAALLLRVLSQVDPNADGEFVDVKKSDWFYGTAGSAKKYGMILGFEDNTFRGNTTIAKDQILAIASRVLKREMKYKTPDNISEWLTFTDASVIADWAREDIALATMANIITRSEDNTIKSNEDMTRGDAALIIMRLFYKIW